MRAPRVHPWHLPQSDYHDGYTLLPKPLADLVPGVRGTLLPCGNGARRHRHLGKLAKHDAFDEACQVGLAPAEFTEQDLEGDLIVPAACDSHLCSPT